MSQIGAAWQEGGGPHNVVVVATQFSESVLANLAGNFQLADTINVVPLLIPHSPQSNSQLNFLQDLQAITGATILDPLTAPIESASVLDVGGGVEGFECSRFRSSVLGHADPEKVAQRVEELNEQLKNPESQLDAMLTTERKAKLTGGIARLHVIGSSNGELKERKDRAEDAVCAVRGAIKYGCLPGGAWMLLKIMSILPRDRVSDEIVRPALMAPFQRLVSNSGVVDDFETKAILDPILQGICDGKQVVYDFLNQKHVDAFEGGVLDSAPAVREAVKNSISIATQTGTMGGIVVFLRDHELEKKEALNTADWIRNATVNEANERP
jgi:chaperonin GroEL